MLRIAGDQYVDEPLPGLRAGTADTQLTYQTNAQLFALPVVDLPDEVSLGNPALAGRYAAVYTNPQGQAFRGTPLVYSATVPSGAANPAGAALFVRYLLSDQGRAALAGRGFETVEALVGGDMEAVPNSLRGLVRKRHLSRLGASR